MEAPAPPCAHKRQCANRILIGPWDARGHALDIPTPNAVLARDSTSDNGQLLSMLHSASTSLHRTLHHTNLPSSDRETAESTLHPPNATDATPLQPSIDKHAQRHYGSISKRTGVGQSALTQPSSTAEHLTTVPKSLSWRKKGAVFRPPQPTVSFPQGDELDPNDVILKQGILLCTRSVSLDGGADRPSRFMTARESRYGQLREDWRQMDAVLTNATLSLYSNPWLIWPRKRLEHQIPLWGKRMPNQLRLTLLSPLDYTFCIKYTSKSGSFVTFTFRARSATLCQEWYLAIYRMLPSNAKRVCSPWCEVRVPLINVSVHLPLAPDGKDLRYDITIENVKDVVLALLAQNETWAKQVKQSLSKNDVGLCWTRKDRAEWVYWKESVDGKQRTDLVIGPQHIEQTHQLELRHIVHMPNQIERYGTTLNEPYPIEGYLLRLTDFSGHPILPGQLTARRRYYFSTFDQFLFYTAPSKVKMPHRNIQVDTLEPSSGAPSGPPHTLMVNTFAGRGEYAAQEIERRMQLMTGATGVIDLTTVLYVRRSFGTWDYGSYASVLADSETPILPSNTSQSNASISVPSRDPCIELVFDNDLIIQFEAQDSISCEIWIHHLSKLIMYWKSRREAEYDIQAKQHANQVLVDKLIPKDTQPNESARAPTLLWSHCRFDLCRDIIKAGVMYFQPRSRGTFTEKMFVLTSNGWLLYFNKFERMPISCLPIASGSHEHKGSLDMAGCYVYSGQASLDNKKQRDPCRPPRIFDDGMATEDADENCVFSLWKPLARRFYSTKRKRVIVCRGDKGFVGSRGETWQFLARSRQERDEWVCAINAVIEHLIRQL